MIGLLYVLYDLMHMYIRILFVCIKYDVYVVAQNLVKTLYTVFFSLNFFIFIFFVVP